MRWPWKRPAGGELLVVDLETGYGLTARATHMLWRERVARIETITTDAIKKYGHQGQVPMDVLIDVCLILDPAPTHAPRPVVRPAAPPAERET